MGTHSSILAWRISWTEEPGRLQSMGLQRVGHNWVTNTFGASQVVLVVKKKKKKERKKEIPLSMWWWWFSCWVVSITSSQSLLKLMSIELVMPSNHLILCCPLLLLPSVIPSIKVFSNESVLCIRWPKYWSFRFSISPSNEYSGLISFRIPLVLVGHLN